MPASTDSHRTDHPEHHATVFGAVQEGWRRALTAPALALAVWMAATVVTLPLTGWLHRVGPAAGDSRVAGDAAPAEVDLVSAALAAADADGVAGSYLREIVGVASMVATSTRLLEDEAPSPALTGALVVYLAFWAFFSGGIVDRLARARPLGAATFIALSGHYFSRLVRLAAIAGVLYWFLFRSVYPVLFGPVLDWWMRDGSSESRMLAGLAGLSLLFTGLVALVSVTLDFTRVRLVVEDRRSVLSALGAGLRFVRRRFWRVAAVYGLNLLVVVAVGRLWLQVSTGGGPGTGWLALLLTQVYVIVRIVGRLAFLASEAVFFQGELAHAQYTAAPLPQWPDSVSVEAVRNLKREA